jgi:hypothetical protein
MYFDGTNWIRLAKGSADEVLTMNNGATAPEWEAGGGGAVTREGGNTTEATTNSTTRMSLLSAGSLDIAVATPIYAICVIRKPAVATESASVGLMLNALNIQSPVTWTGSTNSAAQATAEYLIPSRLSNYDNSGGIRVLGNTGGVLNNIAIRYASNLFPQATITDFIVQALVSAGSESMSADELQVYSFAIS